jgi:membrane-bound lytic murein transglycosylase B
MTWERKQRGAWLGSLGRAAACAALALGCASAAALPPSEPEPAAEPSAAAAPPPAETTTPPVSEAAPAEPASLVAAPPPPAGPTVDGRLAAAKGWAWLVERLVRDGVAQAVVERAFADPRIPAFDGLFFAANPREPRSMYRSVLARRSVAQARACAGEYAHSFREAERETGVPAELVAAILHVETRCGRNTGSSIVLFGLARLAMANEPVNLEANLERQERARRADPGLADRLRARAAVLDETFYPEVRAVFSVAEAEGIDPLDLRGSRSGAFGYPQFLPTSYLRFGADGNGDGRVDLYDVDDAAASAARYLASHGWGEAQSRAAQRRVIWHYNRSDAYIDAVLGLAARLRGSVGPFYARSAGGDRAVEAGR